MVAARNEARDDASARRPTLPLLHASFFLAGFGTLLLGPLLPLLSLRWHLRDSQSGLLLLAQFCGATLGGSTVTDRLEMDLLMGLGSAALGFLAFSLAPGWIFACAALVLGGFGVGRVISSANIMAGARYTERRGTALSWLNFSWSCGALLSPLLAAWLPASVPLPDRLGALALCFFAVGSASLLQLWRVPRLKPALNRPANVIPSLDARGFFYFATFLVLYGGLETCLGAWLTTFALRYATKSLILSEYTLALLLCGLTAGRALSAWLLRRMDDAFLQRLALAAVMVLIGALALSHRPMLIAPIAILLGICLAPIFPTTFSLLMASNPPARHAGMILAASGLGAAGLPALMGLISSETGSLQVALSLPVLAALAMLTLSVQSTAPADARL